MRHLRPICSGPEWGEEAYSWVLTPHQFSLLPAHRQSPPHIGRPVLVEQPIPLLNAFAYSSPLIVAPPPPLILLLSLTFFPSSTPPLFLPLIHLSLPQYLHTIIAILLFAIVSFLIQPLFLSGSPFYTFPI